MKYDVSVVIATYQAQATLRAAIESLLADESAAVEVIVVDDASTDDSFQSIRSLEDRIRYTKLPVNAGRAHARNVGIAQSTTDLIAVLDADDLSCKGRLGLQRDFLRQTDFALVSGQYIEFGAWGRGDSPSTLPTEPDAIHRRLSGGKMSIAHPACMFRKSWFERVGGYDPDLRWCEDFDLVLRGQSSGRYAALNSVFVEYRREHDFVSWPYWYENERHRRAIFARWRRSISGQGHNNSSVVPRDGYLLRGFELARYMGARARYSFARL